MVHQRMVGQQRMVVQQGTWPDGTANSCYCTHGGSSTHGGSATHMAMVGQQVHAWWVRKFILLYAWWVSSAHGGSATHGESATHGGSARCTVMVGQQDA